MTTEEIAESVEAFTSAMNGHLHDLHPVVSDGELVASVCGSCWTQCSPQAWVRQNDAIIDLHERQERIANCGEHDREEVEILSWGQAPGTGSTITTPCRKCGG